MNFAKRALRSVTRQKGKTIILFAILFVLGNLIAGATSIQQATGNVEKETKRKLGATATAEIDYEKYADKLNSSEVDVKPLKVDTIKKIGELKYVKYYDYSFPGNFMTEKLKSVPEEQPEGEEVINSVGGDMPSNFFFVRGIGSEKFLPVQQKEISLKSGRVFTAEELEKGKDVAVVSAKFAELNNLSVGKQMIIDNTLMLGSDGGEKKTNDIPVEIVGIFEPAKLETNKKSKEQDFNQMMQMNEQNNTFYMPNNSVKAHVTKMMEQFQEANKAAGAAAPGSMEDYYVPTFVLNSPDEVEAFKQEAKPLLPKYYAIMASTDQYDSIGGSLKTLNKISGYVVIIAVASTVLIVSLLVLLFTRDRKKELGIYLSIGEKRTKIIGQVILEILTISAVALILSLITGNFIGSGVSDVLLRSDLLEQQKSLNDFGYTLSQAWQRTTLTSEEVQKAYKITFSSTYILSFLTIGLGTVLLSAILPLVYILRLNPKKIML
ncbi:putative ABC transport system permease protein [Pilibacter termitis]|uniref:Putative ABC transport system permease protein n=1 Tax=Pilibacter termitis TaxID=263852 RepID=A0A1T4M3I8_9ENTE|nr:ABC transporter permease [Pilibacter termitis]SJZ61457.1 putative ABC transport system permease protein [Pilibacter termitis]